MSTPLKRSRALVKLTLGATAVLFLVGVSIPISISGAGEIQHHGRILHMPVPRPCVKIGAGEDRAIYLAFGYPDLVGVYSRRGPALGWEFAGQDGGVIVLVSKPDDKMRLGVVIDIETRFFTRLDYRLDEPKWEDNPL